MPHTLDADILSCCDQVDASYNTQPESKEAVWNLRGVINNAWHHVQVEAT